MTQGTPDVWAKATWVDQGPSSFSFFVREQAIEIPIEARGITVHFGGVDVHIGMNKITGKVNGQAFVVGKAVADETDADIVRVGDVEYIHTDPDYDY